jgi:hypothetical protein
MHHPTSGAVKMMTDDSPTRTTITAAVRDYHRAFTVSEHCPDLARARLVSAFADTILARLDEECCDAVPDVPGRDDGAWFVGCEYFLAVAVYRAQQVLTTVLDAMHLHGLAASCPPGQSCAALTR